MIIGVDFDGTIVTHEYPGIGQPVPGALETLDVLQIANHRIILWTVRAGRYLDQAVEYLNNHNIKLWGINENPEQKDWSADGLSPKAFCDVYIDDAALGCPLIFPRGPRRQIMGDRPYVDWNKVASILPYVVPVDIQEIKKEMQSDPFKEYEEWQYMENGGR